jgi:TM2 domain-containing membrane protein YozV
MSTIVSQVKFWLDTSATNGENDDGGAGGTYLSYHVLLGLSVLGGFFGLDHIYMRSPVTAIAKFIVNVFAFGLWWLYDAVNIIFNADVVKMYGLGIPGWGPFGIGAGVLAKPIPDKKHLSFLAYSATLIFGGLIGLNSFLVGDRQTGIIRLLSAVSFIFLPLALVWWAYDVFQYMTNLEDVIDSHHQFFGAPHRSLANRMRSRFPLIGLLFSPLESIKTLVNNIFGPALIAPLVGSIDAVTGTVEKAVSAVDNTVQLGREAVAKSGEIVEQVGKTLNTLSQASTMLPAASLYASAQQGLKGAPPQSGGSALPLKAPAGESLNPVGFFLLGILALISLSGYAVTWYRSRNESGREKPGSNPSRDDTPPRPDDVRGAD